MRKRMLRSILALCISAAALPAAKAQSPEYIEPSGFSLGTTFGLADMWGDVGTKTIVDHYGNDKYWRKPHFMGGLFLRYTAHPSFSIRMGASYGTVFADDSWNEHNANKATSPTDDAYVRYLRNQIAKTNIWEGNLIFEFSPFRMGVNSKLAHKRWQPYLMAGIAAYHFRAMGEYRDRVTDQKKWVDLYDLHIEGDGWDFAGAPAKYKKWQMAVPLGVGLRWDIGYHLGLGVEYMYRYCFTDYLDGVSDKYIDPALYDKNLSPQDADIAKNVSDRTWIIVDPNYKHAPGDKRGNKAVNDGYSTISVTFFYKIKRRNTPWWH